MQPTKWEMMFANNSSNKGLTSKIHKELIQLNTKQSYQNIGKGPEQTSFPRRPTNGQQIYEKMLKFTSYYGNVNQNCNRYHLTPVRMAIINKTSNNKCWRG